MEGARCPGPMGSYGDYRHVHGVVANLPQSETVIAGKCENKLQLIHELSKVSKINRSTTKYQRSLAVHCQRKEAQSGVVDHCGRREPAKKEASNTDANNEYGGMSQMR